MQSAAGMTKEEKLFYHCQERYAAVCVSRGILRPTIQGKIMKLMYISYIKKKKIYIYIYMCVTSDQNAGNLPLVLVKFTIQFKVHILLLWAG